MNNAEEVSQQLPLNPDLVAFRRKRLGQTAIFVILPLMSLNVLFDNPFDTLNGSWAFLLTVLITTQAFPFLAYKYLKRGFNRSLVLYITGLVFLAPVLWLTFKNSGFIDVFRPSRLDLEAYRTWGREVLYLVMFFSTIPVLGMGWVAWKINKEIH